MAKKKQSWLKDLPKQFAPLLEAGYLRESQPKGCPRVEGFLVFDLSRIEAGERASDSLAVLAATAYALLPWVRPADSEVAGRALLHWAERKAFHTRAQTLTLWLLATWNPKRLERPTRWPRYELRQHTVDLDVVLGHRTSGSSPFIANGCLLRLDAASKFPSLLNDVAGALTKLEPLPGGFYTGPVVWAETSGTDLLIYLTPYDLTNEGYAAELVDQLKRIPELEVNDLKKVEMPESAVPLFGLDENEDWDTVFIRFLTPTWWDDDVFAAVWWPRRELGSLEGRVRVTEKTSVIPTTNFGQVEAQNALFWFGTPDEFVGLDDF